MKKLCFIFALGIFLFSNVKSQVLVENFDYGTTPDSLLGVTNNWIKHSGGTDLNYITENLTMINYAAGQGIGGAVKMDNNNTEDAHRMVNTLTGTIYYAALVKVTNPTSTSGDYFINLMKDGTTSFYARLFTKKIDANTFLFGIGNGNSDSVYCHTTVFSKDVTYLVVVKYNLDNRIATLYVFDDQNPIEATEPTPPTAQTTVTGNALTDLNSIALRQGSSISDCVVDGLMIVTQWNQLFNATYVYDLKNYVSIYPNPAQNFINISQIASIVTVYNTLGKVVLVNNNTKTVDISKLEAGIYFVDIKTSDNHNEIFKLIKK